MVKLAVLVVIIATITGGISGCFLPPKPPTETAPVVIPYEDSPFGFHPAYVAGSGYEYARDIGVRWDRPALYIFWFKVQADLNRKEYNWSDYDQLFGRLPQGMHVMANIGTVPIPLLMSRPTPATRLLPAARLAQAREQAKQYVREGSYLPTDEEGYLAFVRACVERYDGDGIGDMVGLTNPIRYWQVENEPPRGLRDYAEFLKITYQAVKDADPKAKVIIGGVPGMPPVSDYLRNFDRSYLPILEELAGLEGQYFDIFDIHWYGNATGDYKGLGEVYAYIAQKLDALGLSPPEGYWITEMGTYSGKPVEERFPFQSERQQAQDLIKRYVYSLSLGIKKVFLAFGLVEGFHHTDGYFDHTGLVYDGRGSNDLGLGVKKLSYYTYKKMVEVLEGSDWDNIQIIQEKDGIYIYKLTKQGKPIWVAWNDNDEPRTVRITLTDNIGEVRITEAVPKYESGKEITDYSRAFNELQGRLLASHPVQLEFELGESPVFVEEKVQGESVAEKSAQGEVSSVRFLKKVEIPEAARPEVIAANDRVFIVYLGNIGRAESKTFSVKVFSSDLSREIAAKDMVYSSPEYGSPTDIRVTSDDSYLYAFYETASLKTKKTYLWGAKYTLDDRFERVAFTGPIAESNTFDVAKEGDEKLDDPIALLGENSVFAITRYKSSLEKSGETRYKVYEFTKDLAEITEFDLDLSAVADGSARQASTIYHGGYFYMAVPTTVGPAGPIANVTPSDIVVVTLDSNWDIKESRTVSTDEANPDDAETYVTGFQADNNNFYLTYNQINIPKINTDFTAPLKIYDSDFNLVINEKVRVRKPEEPGLRPSLEITGNRIFIGHSAGKQGEGNAEIYLYEIIREENIKDQETGPGEAFTDQSTQVVLERIKSLKLTDKSDGYGARPEIVSNGECFYIIYLGDITGRRTFKVRIYDMNFNLIKEKVLVSGSLEYGDPTDIRISKDNDYIYAFYELTSKEKGAHLFGAKYKLDEDFTRVAASRGPIARSSFFFDAVDGEETLDDPASVVADGRVYVVTKIKDSGRGLAAARTLYRIRELSPDLSQIIETKDIDLSGTMDGWATFDNLFYANSKIHHIQSSITSFSPKVNPDLKMVRFDRGWGFDQSSDVFNLTNTTDISEGMPAGVRFTQNLLFLSYRVGEVTPVSEGAPSSTGELWLNIYDDAFELIDSIRASSPGLLGQHSTVEVVGSYIYVAYGGKASGETRENIYVDIFKFRD